MPKSTAEHGSRNPIQKQFKSGSTLAEADGNRRYHFNDASLPDAFRHHSNPAMTLVSVSCCLQDCPKEGICWDVIINKDNLPNACPLEENLIRQTMLALQTSNRDPGKTQKLSSTLCTYLHNPALQQWCKWVQSCKQSLLVDTFYFIRAFGLGALLFIAVCAGAMGGLLLISVPLTLGLLIGSIGLLLLPRLFTGVIEPSISAILRKCAGHSRENYKQLECDLRDTLENLHGEQAESPCLPPDKPTSLSDTTTIFPSITLFSAGKKSEMTAVETRLYISPAHLLEPPRASL